MQLDEGTSADVLARLRRIQGQVGASSAWSRPAEGAARSCSRSRPPAAPWTRPASRSWPAACVTVRQDEQAAEQAGYSQDELEKLFLQLR